MSTEHIDNAKSRLDIKAANLARVLLASSPRPPTNPSRKRDLSELLSSNHESNALSMVSTPADLVLQGSDSAHILCARCGTIDFDRIFAKRITKPQGHIVFRFGHISDSLETSPCPLCRFFARMRCRLGVDKASGDSNFDLRAFSGVRAFIVGFSPLERKIPGLADTVCLGLLPRDTSPDELHTSGFIAAYSPPGALSGPRLRIRTLSTSAIDFEILRGWYLFCQRHHKNRCSLYNRILLPALRVIDCLLRRVVTADENCKYAALSYVWGLLTPEPRSLDPPSDPILRSVPNVIEDTITVTLRLRLRYLWVDRYCIRQDDEQDKQTQIRHMDSVYKKAEITIIAAAGEDPNYGLPGVGCKTRVPQLSIQIKETLLLSSLPDPLREIKASKWMKRAWTYQEALLSRRRLIFTEHQVYFECRTMHCCEVIEAQLELLHVKNKEEFRPQNMPGIFPGNLLGKYPWDILQRIKEYSERELTYSSDVLNGMMGILNALKESHFIPKCHYLGVPIMRWISSARGSVEGFLSGLLWDLTEPAGRRGGFPSWSWTGWTGIVATENNAYQNLIHYGDANTNVWIETAASKLISWPTVEQIAVLNNHNSLTPFIHIEGWTFQLQFEFFPLGVPGATTIHQQAPGYYIQAGPNILRWPIRLMLTKKVREGDDLHAKLLAKVWYGIVLESAKGGINCTVLVLDVFCDHAERIGYTTIYFQTPESGKSVFKSKITGMPRERRRFRLG